jgi:hypothetical protein
MSEHTSTPTDKVTDVSSAIKMIGEIDDPIKKYGAVKRVYKKRSEFWDEKKNGIINTKNPYNARNKSLVIKPSDVESNDNGDTDPTFQRQHKKLLLTVGVIPDINNVDLQALGDEMIKFLEKSDEFWLKDFFIHKGIPSTWLLKLVKADEYFQFCYEKALDIMESKLVKLGLKKRNPAFAIMSLKQKHVANWKEVQEIKQDIQINSLAEIVKRARKDKQLTETIKAEEITNKKTNEVKRTVTKTTTTTIPESIEN